MKRIQLIFLLSAFLLGCKNKKENASPQFSQPEKIKIKYASGFKVTALKNATLAEVTYPFQGATSGYKYLLVPAGEEVPEHDAQTRIIYTPVSSIVCTSTTHIPLLDYLDESDKLVGFPTTDFISSIKMRKRIDAGKVTDLGMDKGLNMEMLVSLKPDLVMGYTMSSDYGQFKKMEELGIPVVINAEYLEKHPLGRAEWIKFMALFFNKEKQADSVFQVIEKNYLQVKSMTDTIKHKPSVLSGIVYGDAWFLPGGENYASRILKDAACDYLWGNDQSNGFLQISFEAVYEKAHQADLWIGVGNYANLKEIENADHRYSKFKAFQNKKVYTYDARKGAKGGSEFMELGYLRPDIIIKDLTKIAHPNLLTDYELYFHKKLQ
ncbi:ABC transporter substrate-binding protein [Chryseosolibacter indicus]|uniref:ABC transporter substrate-binding protein n=1 Tax=Chryseosolibacter indicus TaxID=2782351 RepID=A0ABS5VW85_9BACT|nr:ABC transporter substrate-binding protein [Chryseosolibacter indicus]MBT1705082.1 ABC transporter substrate-binding protein [Chryseosolibacter indicus]